MKLLISILLFSFGLACYSHPCPSNPPRQPKAIDKAYLDAHNKRRKQWHEENGVSFVPLKYSFTIKRSAKVWANQLVKESCIGNKGIYHDPNNRLGENIAKTWGSGSWGVKPHPEKILTRFVEREIGKPGAQKGHLTQVIWRPTKYVGCAESSHDYGDGKKCHITVCRYIKPGNCNMGDWSDWKRIMLADDSRCGPECPREGCF